MTHISHHITTAPWPASPLDQNARRFHIAEQRLCQFFDESASRVDLAERQFWVRVYIRVLLVDGEQETLEAMAARLPRADFHALAVREPEPPGLRAGSGTPRRLLWSMALILEIHRRKKL
jgi:hypothetical protein